MVKKIFYVVTILIALFAVYVAVQPSRYRIERANVIAAPQQVVYDQIANFRAWARWAPWSSLDPKMTVDYGGAPSGVGATYHWKGDDKTVGEGKMTIVDAKPPGQLGIRLEFIKPWAALSRNEFVLTPDGGGTKVAWVMSGENDFVGKAYGVFMNMDKAVGPMFEKGLADLRKLAEEESVRARENAAKELKGTATP
jgi:uncharacterized protein YndB with AHSA1/START domain